MRFTPRSKEELEAMNLMKAGVYTFKVANAEEQTSKSGNEMIKLTLEVYDDQGATHIVYDYMLEAMPHKLHAFCQALNMLSQYDSGNMLPHHCIDKCAFVEVIVQRGNANPQGGFYPDKNSVKNYMQMKPKSKATGAVDNAPGTPQGFDDDLPF